MNVTVDVTVDETVSRRMWGTSTICSPIECLLSDGSMDTAA